MLRYSGWLGVIVRDGEGASRVLFIRSCPMIYFVGAEERRENSCVYSVPRLPEYGVGLLNTI